MARISDMDKTIGFRESVMSLKWYISKINKSRPITVRSLKTKYRTRPTESAAFQRCYQMNKRETGHELGRK